MSLESGEFRDRESYLDTTSLVGCAWLEDRLMKSAKQNTHGGASVHTQTFPKGFKLGVAFDYLDT